MTEQTISGLRSVGSQERLAATSRLACAAEPARGPSSYQGRAAAESKNGVVSNGEFHGGSEADGLLVVPVERWRVRKCLG